ncbi:caspase recruitment domain-containing protein 19 isoform X1 [Denticeps clupeoides]|uniref:caspase recruitment domain-containing protein 19 isoform X1 n=1 Tax=Denticeps clupeoides TaxID=299321 RepID=UPI0010A34463|nr:caspase recruitment domain-containing protein 19 isoform X1 [Denticeps clupeoides]
MGDTFQVQLQRDSRFLKADRRLDTELVDKLILQLNRIYPQILTDKEASRFRDLDVPTCVRLAELLSHLQEKGEEACREFYRALHLHAEEVYFSLPTRLDRKGSREPAVAPEKGMKERFILNERGKYTCEDAPRSSNITLRHMFLSGFTGPVFFLGCFSVALGVAILYYYGESKATCATSKALGLAALGLGRRVREVLIWYSEDRIKQ